MTYSQLTIHQKINVKGNAERLYQAGSKTALERAMIGDAGRYGYSRLELLKKITRFDLGWNQSYH